MKALPNDLLSQYEINIKKYSYNRSNYILETTNGKYILRKLNIPAEQILFMYEAVNHLRENGFLQVSLIYPTKKKLPYAISRGQVYVLQSYADGEEVEFKDSHDVKGIVELLANFHKCGVNFDTQHRSSDDMHIKDVYAYFSKRLRETHNLKKKIVPLSQKTEFEIMFLKDYSTYEKLEKMALDCIDPSSCSRVMKQAKETKSLVHNDYKYHTISRVKDGYYLSNVDECTYNMQVLDLSSILVKIMQKNNWDTSLLCTLIQVYEDIRPLSDDEKSVLKALLIFPEKYAAICHKFLQCKRRNNYSMYEVKWENMLVYKDAQVNAAHYIKENL